VGDGGLFWARQPVIMPIAPFGSRPDLWVVSDCWLLAVGLVIKGEFCMGIGDNYVSYPVHRTMAELKVIGRWKCCRSNFFAGTIIKCKT
jgi:hypothetical protein